MTRIETGIGIGLIILASIFAWSWLQAHDAEIKAQSATQERQDADRRVEEARKDTQAQLTVVTATIESLRNQLNKTPAATAPIIIHDQIPALAAVQPTVVTVPAIAATATNPAIPAQQYAQLPLVQFQSAEKDIAARLLDCSTHEAQLNACQADKKADIEAMQAIEKERDAWKLAAGHGGGWLVRLKRNAKWLAFTAGIGAATYEIGHHQ